MGKKIRNVHVRFVFEGNFEVSATSNDEAVKMVENHCGFAMGRGIHSSLPADDIDWEFPVHPEKKILSVD